MTIAPQDLAAKDAAYREVLRQVQELARSPHSRMALRDTPVSSVESKGNRAAPHPRSVALKYALDMAAERLREGMNKCR